MAKRQMTEAQIRKALAESRIYQGDPEEYLYLSSGSSLFNLVLSDRVDRGFAVAGYYWLVGDSDTGKTFLANTCFAEATINPAFDKYDLILDNVERGSHMDVSGLFGQKVADRLQAPWSENGEPVYSETAEDFYFNIDDRLKLVLAGKLPPFIYVLDSMDALTSNYQRKKFEERKKHRRTKSTAKEPGDYGDGKAKINSTNIRDLAARLERARCLVIIISQTRDKIDAGMFESKSTSAGGRALKFYCQTQIWTSPAGKLTQTVNDTKRHIGTVAKIKTRKNRITGRQWTVEASIFNDYGIDDIGANIDFLLQEKRWKMKDKAVDATDLDLCQPRKLLIASIEDDNLEDRLKEIVQETWDGILEKLSSKRKRKYD